MADTDPSLYNLRYNQAASTLEAFGGGTPQWTQVTLNNVDPQQVPVTRQINTTAPLQGGGNLTVDRTLSIPQATSTVDGFLLAADWTTFNGKLTSMLTSANIFVGNGSNMAAGVALSGDATITNTGVLSLSNVNANVGSFTLASITVDAKGRITAASNGTSPGITQLTGDVTAGPGAGSQAATLATVNANVGSFTNANITVNAKGLITAASSGTLGNLTDIGTDGIIVTGGTGAVIGAGTSLAQHVADTTHNGYLSSTDWTTFNNKQSAGNYITALTGDATASGPGSAAITFATVNGNVGSFTNANITVNAKGLITAASSGGTQVTSVSGTTDQITSTGGTTPVLALASPLTTPGAVTISGTLTFSPTTNGIVGTPTNNNTTAGNVGEYISSAVTGVGQNAGSWVNITSISLTAGDWDVTGVTQFGANGGTDTVITMAVSAFSAGTTTDHVQGDNVIDLSIPLNGVRSAGGCIAAWRQSLSTTTTIYLKGFTQATVSSPTSAGRISARRVR